MAHRRNGKAQRRSSGDWRGRAGGGVSKYSWTFPSLLLFHPADPGGLDWTPAQPLAPQGEERKRRGGREDEERRRRRSERPRTAQMAELRGGVQEVLIAVINGSD